MNWYPRDGYQWRIIEPTCSRRWPGPILILDNGSLVLLANEDGWGMTAARILAPGRWLTVVNERVS